MVNSPVGILSGGCTFGFAQKASEWLSMRLLKLAGKILAPAGHGLGSFRILF